MADSIWVRSYDVQGTNRVGNVSLHAAVAATDGAPRVLSVDIESTVNEGMDCGVVTVHFDQAELAASPAFMPSFRLNVTAEAQDAGGGRLLAHDGDDYLHTLNGVDARYDIVTGSGARRWSSVSTIQIYIDARPN